MRGVIIVTCDLLVGVDRTFSSNWIVQKSVVEFSPAVRCMTGKRPPLLETRHSQRAKRRLR